MSEVITRPELIGKVFKQVVATKTELFFFGEKNYRFYHEQNCCESVEIEEILGDLKDLEDSPILLAEAVTKQEQDRNQCESSTWTFYKFSTIKGDVTVRWYGSSNGYYSERVDFEEIR